MTSTKSILQAEFQILKILKYRINLPTRHVFGRYFSAIALCSPIQQLLLDYILELSFIDFELNQFLPSMIAASALHLVLQLTSNRKSLIWPEKLTIYSSYSELDIMPLVRRLLDLHYLVRSSRISCSRITIERYQASAKLNVADAITAIDMRDIRFDCLSDLGNSKAHVTV